jgi:hypothetical protein
LEVSSQKEGPTGLARRGLKKKEGCGRLSEGRKEGPRGPVCMIPLSELFRVLIVRHSVGC